MTGYLNGSTPGAGAARIALQLALAFVLAMSWVNEAQARKVALIIGNSLYQNTAALQNPANDARLIAGAAEKAGFEVTLLMDLTIRDFQLALRNFRTRADGSDAAMIYYAGHAIEGQGRNWLIPVDAMLETSYDLPYETINIDRSLEALSGSRLRMLILDSCRNNPLGNSWRRGIRAVPAGMRAIDVDDFIIIYAAAPGQVALDGIGNNSPFAASVARRLPQPGLPVQLLGGAVRDDVLESTGGKQRPFVNASVTGTPYYLVGGAPQPGAVSGPAQNQAALEALAWQGASSSGTLAAYATFLEQFPNGIFAGMARKEMEQLGGASAVASRPSQTRTASGRPAPAESPGLVSTPQPPGPAPKPKVDPGVRVVDAEESPGLILPGEVRMPADEGKLAVTSMSALNEARRNSRLPSMPATPQFSDAAYPQCRDNFQQQKGALEKVQAVNACTEALNAFYTDTMLTFRLSMTKHQEVISDLYSQKVGGNPVFTPKDQTDFYRAMRAEHAASDPDGPHFSAYRTTEQRYQTDTEYLKQQYCELAGCTGEKMLPK